MGSSVTLAGLRGAAGDLAHNFRDENARSVSPRFAPLRVWSGMDFIIFGLNVVTGEELAGIEASVNAKIAAKMTGK